MLLIIYAAIMLCLWGMKINCHKLDKAAGYKVGWAWQLYYATCGGFIASVIFKPFW